MIEDKFNDAKMTVSWCLQEAYKIAVHNCGIADWSEYQDYYQTNMHSTVKVVHPRKKDVENMQIEIAKMLQKELHTN